MKKKFLPYIFSTPGITLLLIIDFFPIIYTLYLSVHRAYLLKKDWSFIGLENFIRAMYDSVFWLSLENSFLWSFGIVFFSFIIGLTEALLLDQPIRLRGLFRSLLFLPWVLPSVLLTMMWRLMFIQNQSGLINHVLMQLGIISEPVTWLNFRVTVMLVAISGGIFRGTAFFAIMLLAGLQAIPRELYEAAKIDGASSTRIFWFITLPQLSNIVIITLIIYWIWMFNWLDLIWMLTKGGPGNLSHILPTYAYTQAFRRWDFGYSAVLSVIMIIIMTTIAVLMSKLSNKTV